MRDTTPEGGGSREPEDAVVRGASEGAASAEGGTRDTGGTGRSVAADSAGCALRGGKRRLWTGAAALAVLTVALGAAAVHLTAGAPAQSEEGGAGLPPATTEVTQEDLTDSRSASGKLGYGPVTEVSGRQSGTLTKLPQSGAGIGRGETLFEVDTDPVTVMYGDHPAYRRLAVGAEGTDVRQLERNLSELGYEGFTADGTYTWATATAVMEWQRDRGTEQTGTVELGTVVFTSGAVRVDSLKAEEGDRIRTGGPVLEYTGTQQLVTAELEPEDRRLAEEGGAVEITLPGGESVDGRIEDVAVAVRPESQEEDRTVVEVVVSFDGEEAERAAAEYPLAAVDASFVAETREEVLTVPVAALVAMNGGGFGVEVVDESSSAYVPVETGLFADGRVEVSGDGISEGSVVGVPK
ncbi:peptidoglycan-binding protein [Streptomonospora salina]|uniref:Peptidoglycan hydrolase-like protein with peptidoglycan-binding domain n=1 Tax=Streptomonospora salina TaxID=104205 RepID=A0A841E8V1_9ACTN|nr:peptidoglycan-binding protein [Streptomonospora salina]MBB5997749.1 peptidoglycan hydrolase-like protein with peptidoglycan-binding domain [Streptomonospora salina]